MVENMELYKQSPLATVVKADKDGNIKLPILQFGVPNINGRIYTAEHFQGFEKGSPDEQQFSSGFAVTLLDAQVEEAYLVATGHILSPVIAEMMCVDGLFCYPAARGAGSLDGNIVTAFTLLGFDLIPLKD